MTEFTLIDLHQALWTIAVGIVCNVSCALLGCFLVLRRLSLLGDAISHGVLPGIVLAVLLTQQLTGWPIVVGAMIFGLLTAFLTQTVHHFARVPEDACMGVVFTSLFALGVVLISLTLFHVHVDTDCVLLGIFEQVADDTMPVLGLEIPRALPTMLLSLLVTIAFILVFWKELKIASFDPALATAMGLNATLLHYLLLAMVAMVTVTAFEAVGSILVIAMLIVPGATAHLLSDRLAGVLLWGVGVAIMSAVVGYVLASRFVLDTNVGSMMALAAGLQFSLAVLFAPRHGLLAGWLRQARLAMRIAAEDVLARLYRQEEAQPAAAAATLPGRAGLLGRLALWKLLRQGKLCRSAAAGFSLTEKGRQDAASIVRAHRLWEVYLGKNFELPLDHLHEAAERVEHYLGPALQKELAAELQQPGVDPHGRSIPPT